MRPTALCLVVFAHLFRPPTGYAWDLCLAYRTSGRSCAEPAIQPFDTVASAINLGMGMASLLGSYGKSPLSDSNQRILQAYQRASLSAADLGFDLPYPPACRPLSVSDSTACPRVAEGWAYTFATIGTINAHLDRQFGKRVSAAFMFSCSVLGAHIMAVDQASRESWLKHATEAAEALVLPMAFVDGVFQHARVGTAQQLIGDLERLKELLRSPGG